MLYRFRSSGRSRRHRTLHPVHRLRQRRADRFRLRTGFHTAWFLRWNPGHSRVSGHDGAIRLHHRPGHYFRALRAQDPRRADHLDHRDDDHRDRDGVQPIDTSHLVATPNFSTLGLGLQNPFEVFAKLGFISAGLTIFAIMLSDFFDTMGTVTGIAAEAGLSNPDGSVPGVGRVLMVDSVAAIAGGLGGVSSNTTYIESAAGVAAGARTGLASVVVGILFLLAIFLSPIAGLIPTQATAPALVLVGYLMFTLVKDIPVRTSRRVFLHC